MKRTVLLRHDTPAPGFEAVLVQVDLPVGAREGRHTHPGLLLIHVEEGTLTLDTRESLPPTTNPGVPLPSKPARFTKALTRATLR